MIILATLILWVLFVNVMALKDFANRQTGWKLWVVMLVGYPFVIVAFIYDILFNITYGTIIFMEWPHYERLTLTARMKHIILTQRDTWRFKIAKAICRYLVEPWDKGHCGL